LSQISENIKKLLNSLPENIILEAACKTRTSEEIQEAVNAGVKVLGENYIQEAEEAKPRVSGNIRWHFIGHLQRNKVKKAVKIFDMIESLDSIKLAAEINKKCAKIKRVMECLIEINSGREENKFGVFPEDAESFLSEAASFGNLRIKGLMTMGPFMGTAEEFRPYFRTTREIFEELKKKSYPNAEMKYLSMGMTASYKTAIEEGANIVRIGTGIFGPRE